MIDRNTISLIANIARSSAADAMYKQAQQPVAPGSLGKNWGNYEPTAPGSSGKNWGNHPATRAGAGASALGSMEGLRDIHGSEDIRGMMDSAINDPTNTGADMGYGPGYDPYQYGVPSIPREQRGEAPLDLMPTDRPDPSTNPFGRSPFGPRGGYPDDSPFKLPKDSRPQRSPLPFPAYGGGPGGNPLRGWPPLGGGLGGGLGVPPGLGEPPLGSEDRPR